VDVGGFAEPRKILCQCALPSYEQVSVHPRSAHGGAGIPQQIETLMDFAQLLLHLLQPPGILSESQIIAAILVENSFHIMYKEE